LAKLFSQNERGVALVIAKTRVGRWTHGAGDRQIGSGKRFRHLLREKGLKGFHCFYFCPPLS
jgi:hypothetical protein